MAQHNHQLERQTRLTARGLAVLIGAAALAVPGILLGATALVTMCLTAMCVVAIAALTQRVTQPLRLNFLAIEPQPATLGETLTIIAKFSYQHPAWHVFFSPNPQLGASTGPPTNQTTHRLITHARGTFTLGTMRAYRSDVLSLCRTRITWDFPHRISVYPRLYELPAPQLTGSRGTPAGLVPAGYTTDDVTLRAYIPGDELRRIHWPATARHGQPIVRSADIRTSKTVNIVLDNRLLGTDSRAFEWVVSLATSAALSAIANNWTVRIIHARSRRASNAPVFTSADDVLHFAAHVTAVSASLPLASTRSIVAQETVIAILQTLDDQLHTALVATSLSVAALVYDGGTHHGQRFTSAARFRIVYRDPQGSVVELWRKLNEVRS